MHCHEQNTCVHTTQPEEDVELRRSEWSSCNVAEEKRRSRLLPRIFTYFVQFEVSGSVSVVSMFNAESGVFCRKGLAACFSSWRGLQCLQGSGIFTNSHCIAPRHSYRLARVRCWRFWRRGPSLEALKPCPLSNFINCSSLFLKSFSRCPCFCSIFQ